MALRNRSSNPALTAELSDPEPAVATQPVQMRLRKETIRAIDKLKDFFEVSSRTDAIVRSVRLAEKIASEIREGARVELHREDGQVLELLVR